MLQLLPLAHLVVLLQSSFIPVAAQAVRLLQVSANKRYLAAAECPHSGSAQQQVSIYNVPAQKREQTLQLAPHAKGSTITSMSFRCVCRQPQPQGSSWRGTLNNTAMVTP